MSENQERSAREWIDEANRAFERAGSALREAWEATRDSRLGALEAAKAAAHELSEALDRGIDVAKERWESSGGETAEEE